MTQLVKDLLHKHGESDGLVVKRLYYFQRTWVWFPALVSPQLSVTPVPRGSDALFEPTRARHAQVHIHTYR